MPAHSTVPNRNQDIPIQDSAIQLEEQKDQQDQRSGGQLEVTEVYLENASSGHDSQLRPRMSPQSFTPIMVLGRGSFGEVYLVQKNSN